MPRAISAVLVALMIAVIGVLAYLLLFAPPLYTAYVFVGDDAGYYFNIARNYCMGFGVSYDRVGLTNGLNPLEPLLLIGLFKFIKGLSVETCYRVGSFLSLVVLVAGIPYLKRFLSKFTEEVGFGERGRNALVLAGLCFYVFFLVPKHHYGLDAPLVYFLGAVYVARLFDKGLLEPGWRGAFIDGSLLGLLFLARVDMLPLLVVVYGVSGVVALRQGAVPGLLLRVLITAAFALPFILWSADQFGTWMPVSAKLKNGFPHIDLAQSIHAIRFVSLRPIDQAMLAIGYLASLIGLVVIITQVSRKKTVDWTRGVGGVMLILTLYVFLRLTYMLLFSRLDVQGGYAVLVHVYNVCALIMVAKALTNLASRKGESTVEDNRIALVAAGCLIIASLGLLAGKAMKLRSSVKSIVPGGVGDDFALGRDIHDMTSPSDVVYGAGDRPGMAGAFGLLGYFADRPWINGDGVANNYKYQEAIRDHELARYLRENRVTYIAFDMDPNPPPGPLRIYTKSFMYNVVDSVPLDPGAVILRRRIWNTPDGEFWFARWRDANSELAPAK